MLDKMIDITMQVVQYETIKASANPEEDVEYTSTGGITHIPFFSMLLHLLQSVSVILTHHIIHLCPQNDMLFQRGEITPL